VIRALVFDFDGLILDTESAEFRCWQEIYEAHGGRLDLATWAACIGTAPDAFDPEAHLARQIGRALDLAAVRARKAARLDALVAAETVRPGIVEYLDGARAHGLALGVASSSGRAWVTGHLARLGLRDRFDTIRCAEDVARVKPDPALYLRAVADLGVAPAAAVALEDSPNGVLAAKRAGLRCVAVPNPLTAALRLDAADLTVPSLAALPLESLLRRLGAGDDGRGMSGARGGPGPGIPAEP
jgi:HAD superfamily hydrolase (TIGR01509 family)